MSVVAPRATILGINPKGRDVPNADLCTAAKSSLFDHFVGSDQQTLRHGETELFCSLEVDDHLEFGGLLHGQVGRICTAQNSVGIVRGKPKLLDDVWAVRHQTTFPRVPVVGIHGR